MGAGPLRGCASIDVLPLLRNLETGGDPSLVFLFASGQHHAVHLHHVALDLCHSFARGRDVAGHALSAGRVAEGVGVAVHSSTSSGISAGSVGLPFFRYVLRLFFARNFPALKWPRCSTSKFLGMGGRIAASPVNCFLLSRMISARSLYSFTSPRISMTLPASWRTSPTFFRS